MRVVLRNTVIGLALALSCGHSLASVRAYTPRRVSAHTSTLLSVPYVVPTASGDADLVVDFSNGWEPDRIPVHPLYGYRITDPFRAQPKQTVVMISGNHNAEHSGNWVLQGVVDFWISDDPVAELLRGNSDLYVYPMVNPDGRLTGIGRGNPELAAQGLTDHNRVWNQTGFSTIDALTTAMKMDTGGQVDYFFDFHSDNGSAGNYFNTVPELVTSDFSAAMTLRDPAILPVPSTGDPGMARIWAMSPSGLNATFAYTPEQHDLFSERQYRDIGRTYALALADVIVPQPPALQPGDADMDLDFDQLDLIRVQQAAKYLTGQPATWGSGDWNGAPGGAPGNPPTGDGRFDQDDIMAALGPGHYLTGRYAVLLPGGREGDGQTSGGYNARAGQVSIDAAAGRAEDFLLDDLSMARSLAGGGDWGEGDRLDAPEPSTLLLLGLALIWLPSRACSRGRMWFSQRATAKPCHAQSTAQIRRNA